MAPPKGWKPTAEQRKRMGDSHRGFKHSPEVCKKYSESKKGEKNPMFGIPHTEEWKSDMSKKLKGRPKSKETKERMHLAQLNRSPRKKGYKRSLEDCKKISDGRMGIVFSEEHLKHLSEAHIGQIVSPETRKKRSDYNKAHPEIAERLRHLRCKHPSKPQKLLFEAIKTIYPDEEVVMECRVDIMGGRRFIDIAIPRLLRGWEYDSPTYHGSYWGSKEKDMIRHKLIENEGWELTHYHDVSEFPKEK